MGKHGPCYHCGVTSTPLWRNGPPEKPVLCNACGSRWRTKGTLANYTPLHARAESDEIEDLRFSRLKTISSKNKESKVLKRKLNNVEIAEFGVIPPDHNQVLHKCCDEDASNRSSSGSAISNSEKYTQYGVADTSDLTSPPQPSAWDSMVPSRKRTCVGGPKPSPVEALTKDLYTLWYEQQSSCLSGSSEEDLLLESDKPMVSVEIGHGSVLIRHPSSVVREEESEASSLSVDKQYTSNSRLMSFQGFIEDTGAYPSSKANEKIKKSVYPGAVQEQSRRDKDQVVKLPILAHHNSPLCYIDLQDIINFDMFSSHLTNDEQSQLMKLLPSVDTSDAPYSLRSMFGSSEFNENLSSFQKLIAEGVFDNSFGRINTEDCRILKQLVLCDLAKSKWVEQHTAFKNLKCKSSIKSEVVTGATNLKRSRDGQHQKNTGSKVMIKSPRRIVMKSSYSQKEFINKDDSFVSAKSLFSIQNDNGSSSVLDTSHFEGENLDQDLLLDVPSNASFPQAELLPSSSFGGLASTSSSSVYPNLVRP